MASATLAGTSRSQPFSSRLMRSASVRGW
ncbi:MAG: hypothetical protein RL105_1488, partial [Verrucomicrobiota bacterium]